MQIRVHHQFMILERRSCMIKELSLASIPSAADMYGLERKPKTFNSQNDIRKEIPEIYVLSVFFSVSCMNTQGIFFFFLFMYLQDCKKCSKWSATFMSYSASTFHVRFLFAYLLEEYRLSTNISHCSSGLMLFKVTFLFLF